MIILTVCSTKGGVGKTSLCANLGGFAADSGWKVLLVDCDPQPSLSYYFSVTVPSQYCVSRVFSHSNFRHCISETSVSHLDIVLSDSHLNHTFSRINDGWNRLKQALAQLESYDLVVIDTQGSTSLIVDATILCSDLLLSPIVPDMISAREFLRGIPHTLVRLEKRFGEFRLPPNICGLIYRTRATIDSRVVSQQLEEMIRNLKHLNLLKTSVPDRTIYREAATARLPVHRLELRRQRGISAFDTMRSLTAEILPELINQQQRAIH